MKRTVFIDYSPFKDGVGSRIVRQQKAVNPCSVGIIVSDITVIGEDIVLELEVKADGSYMLTKCPRGSRSGTVLAEGIVS